MSAAAARKRLAEYTAKERDGRMQAALVLARAVHDAVSAVYEETFEGGGRDAAHRVIAASLYEARRAGEAEAEIAAQAEARLIVQGGIDAAVRALQKVRPK